MNDSARSCDFRPMGDRLTMCDRATIPNRPPKWPRSARCWNAVQVGSLAGPSAGRWSAAARRPDRSDLQIAATYGRPCAARHAAPRVLTILPLALPAARRTARQPADQSTACRLPIDAGALAPHRQNSGNLAVPRVGMHLPAASGIANLSAGRPQAPAAPDCHNAWVANGVRPPETQAPAERKPANTQPEAPTRRHDSFGLVPRVLVNAPCLGG